MFSIYSPLPYHKAGDYPISPFIHIAADGVCNDIGKSILTPQLMTDSEIDPQINALIAELEKLRKSAKADLLKRKRLTLTPD